MQKLWQEGTNWDSPVTASIMKEWEEFKNDIHHLERLSIPRHVCINDHIRVEVHAFGDASERAYGATIYIRSVNQANEYLSKLICSKARVAPLNRLTLPRLELCAAVLTAQLCCKVVETLTVHISSVTYWTDSTIVLHWIGASPTRFKTFVANRIAEIQRLTQPSQWRHVTSKNNPADFPSRGCSSQELATSNLWWKGPLFLETSNDLWPQQPEIREIDNSSLETKVNHSITLTTVSTSSLTTMASNFSCWNRFVRVITYCFRWYRKVKKEISKTSDPLTYGEVRTTTKKIIRQLQAESFSEEIRILTAGKPLDKKTNLLQLQPFLDTSNLLRVGGRLKHANVDLEHRHPVLLPSNNKITHLIMKDIHIRHLHCGREQIISLTRLKYWPISARTVASRITRECIECQRFRPSVPSYVMGNLPTERIQQVSRPFIVTGIDFAGPIAIKESRRRGRTVTTKGYIAIFVCFSTKATHLELVTSLSTEYFLASLKRFIARRGIPNTIFSDNGTNFVGANRELRETYQFMEKHKNSLQEEISNLKINWQFQPPRAPNFGGLWETTVKSFKRHFYKVTHGFAFTFEECYTLITQIESVLNSRPLSYLSTDPHDFEILTPSHFLIGDTLLEPPEYDHTQVKVNRLRHYQHIQQIRHHFWNRWKKEYLHTLQMRQKWIKNGSTSINIDDMVLLMEDNTPPLHWPRGRVTRIHPGDDGITRVATIKTKSGEYKRPVRKLCVLRSEAL